MAMVDSSPSRERLTRVVELLRGAEDEHEATAQAGDQPARRAVRPSAMQRSRDMLPVDAALPSRHVALPMSCSSVSELTT
jgi:hypothetical protein